MQKYILKVVSFIIAYIFQQFRICSYSILGAMIVSTIVSQKYILQLLWINLTQKKIVFLMQKLFVPAWPIWKRN
jgi:hypothetical protein